MWPIEKFLISLSKQRRRRNVVAQACPRLYRKGLARRKTHPKAHTTFARSPFPAMWRPRLKTSAFPPFSSRSPVVQRRVMNCVSQVSSYAAAIFRATGRAVGTSSLCGPSSWKRRLDLYAGIKPISIESALTTFRIQPYSSARSSGGSKTTPSRSRRRKADSEPVMEPEKEGFYVVRKGDVVGVYRSFSDCQAQLGSSVKFNLI